MDVGHVRSVRWVKDDNPQSPINSDLNLTKNGKTAAQNRWIAYNKAKGQYSSAMEHATPEQFWVDKSQCKYTDDKGVIQNPSKADCAQGISAVKAIAIAQSQGQKIYTINPQNRDTALPKLTLSGAAGEEIRSAINAGKEVTFHEGSINAYGWHGVGYSIVDPDTGAGSYLIEGAGNGGWLTIFFLLLFAVLMIPLQLFLISAGLLIAATVAGVAGLIATVLVALSKTDLFNPALYGFLRFLVVIGLFVTLPFSAGAATIAATVAVVMATVGFIAALILANRYLHEDKTHFAYFFRKNGSPSQEIS